MSRPSNYTYKSQFADAIRGAIAWRAPNGYSATTYDSAAKLFDEFCIKCHPEEKELTRALFFDWLKHEIDEGRKISSDKGDFYRFLGRYLISIGQTAYIPEAIGRSNRNVFTRPIFTERQIKLLFDAIDKYAHDIKRQDPMFGQSFPTLCRLCLTCGLRPGETVNLKRRNINYSTGEIFIENGKGNKDRIVVAGDDMLKLLRYQEKVVKNNYPESEFFFINSRGENPSTGRIKDLLTSCWRRANPDTPRDCIEPICLYTFRHEFATLKLLEWSKKGTDYVYRMIPYLRIYMGHSCISQTLYYVHLLPEFVSENKTWNNSINQLNLGETIK